MLRRRQYGFGLRQFGLLLFQHDHAGNLRHSIDMVGAWVHISRATATKLGFITYGKTRVCTGALVPGQRLGEEVRTSALPRVASLERDSAARLSFCRSREGQGKAAQGAPVSAQVADKDILSSSHRTFDCSLGDSLDVDTSSNQSLANFFYRRT